MRRDLFLASGENLVLHTALNDPVGRWTVAVRDCITRQIGEAGVEVMARQPQPEAPAFLAWGQPSELWAPSRPPAREFVD